MGKQVDWLLQFQQLLFLVHVFFIDKKHTCYKFVFDCRLFPFSNTSRITFELLHPSQAQENHADGYLCPAFYLNGCPHWHDKRVFQFWRTGQYSNRAVGRKQGILSWVPVHFQTFIRMVTYLAENRIQFCHLYCGTVRNFYGDSWSCDRGWSQ